MSWKVNLFTQVLSVQVVNCSGDDFGVAVLFYKCCHNIIHQSPCPLSLIGQTYLSLSNHYRHSLWGLVGSSANPDVENFFLFISVVVYVDTATAWSNDSPVFFFFSSYFLLFFLQMDPALLYIFFSPFYPTYLSPFLFCWFVCFWRQQVGIDQGDIPDLSQVSVHLTFAFLFSLFLILTPILAFPPAFSPFVSGFPSTLHVVSLLPLCFHPSTRVLFHPYIYLCRLPLPPFTSCSLILSLSLSTHSFLFQTTRLTWS